MALIRLNLRLRGNAVPDVPLARHRAARNNATTVAFDTASTVSSPAPSISIVASSSRARTSPSISLNAIATPKDTAVASVPPSASENDSPPAMATISGSLMALISTLPPRSTAAEWVNSASVVSSMMLADTDPASDAAVPDSGVDVCAMAPPADTEMILPDRWASISSTSPLNAVRSRSVD